MTFRSSSAYFFGENLPTRAAFLHFFRALQLEGVRGGFRSIRKSRTHFAHQFTKALQRATIIFVVLIRLVLSFESPLFSQLVRQTILWSPVALSVARLYPR